MNFFRILFYHRRRRKQKFFLLIFLILILSSLICYWWIEIYSFKYEQNLFEQQNNQSENDQLIEQDPIYARYIQHPYNIDLWSIIKEANSKYQENNEKKYLVYSCRFMCGGIKRKFLIEIKICFFNRLGRSNTENCCIIFTFACVKSNICS